jgi:S1-C subfamily serine protease
VLAGIAAVVITIGAVASAITAVLDLGERFTGDGSGETSGPKASRGPKTYLGVEVRDFVTQVAQHEPPQTTQSGSVTPSGREATIILPSHGVRVTAVDSNSPASRAGVKRGDIITAINGRNVQDVDAFRTILSSAEAGTHVRLSITRGVPTGITLPDGGPEMVTPDWVQSTTHRVSIRVRLESI